MSEAADDVVRVEHRGRVTVVTITREDKRNAINADVAAGIDAAFNDFEDDSDQWVAIITGGPNVFCAGTDLKDGPGRGTERGGEYGIIRRRRTKPLIAAVEGLAFGGGFEICMASDMVVAADDARFALPEVKRGVIANSGALFRTARLLPPNVAKELLLTGAEMSAARAHELGFVNRVVPKGTALDAAVTLAETVAANAPVSVQQTLQAVDAVLSGTDDEGWAATARGQAEVMASDDIKEGIAAFLEKREPRWTGR
ncbi:MAG: enoyl-CoA hydratase-related protein [Acidimicrobiales bacterium]|nr:enoyl-CoA hydratase-related protein [Acidimicrobiales bacterium]